MWAVNASVSSDTPLTVPLLYNAADNTRHHWGMCSWKKLWVASRWTSHECIQQCTASLKCSHWFCSFVHGFRYILTPSWICVVLMNPLHYYNAQCLHFGKTTRKDEMLAVIDTTHEPLLCSWVYCTVTKPKIATLANQSPEQDFVLTFTKRIYNVIV